MAYMSQETKSKIAPAVKAVLKKYGVKGTLAVRNHSTLVLNIKSGKLDFIRNFNETIQTDVHMFGRGFTKAETNIDVNPYHYEKHFSGKVLKFVDEIMKVMNKGNWDKSDIQTDYFNVGWYTDINIGRWNKPYILEK